MSRYCGALRKLLTVPAPQRTACLMFLGERWVPRRAVYNNFREVEEGKTNLVGKHEEAGPGRSDGGGVLPSKEGGDEHARDLLICGGPSAVGHLVAAVHEVLQQVVLGAAGRPAPLDHLAEDACQLLAGPAWGGPQFHCQPWSCGHVPRGCREQCHRAMAS